MNGLIKVYAKAYNEKGELEGMVYIGKINTSQIKFIDYGDRITYQGKMYFLIYQDFMNEVLFVEKEDADKL